MYTGNLVVSESMATTDVPLETSLVTVLGEKYADSVNLLLKHTRILDLMHLTEAKIKSYGFTTSAAKKVLAIIQFAITLQNLPEGQYVTIRSPRDAACFMSYLQDETQEHLMVLFLNTKNQVIARRPVIIGTLKSSVINPRDVMREALKVSCASMILCSNHISGKLRPSPEEVEVTKRLVEAGCIVGLTIKDHVILGGNTYISLNEKGYVKFEY